MGKRHWLTATLGNYSLASNADWDYFGLINENRFHLVQNRSGINNFLCTVVFCKVYTSKNGKTLVKVTQIPHPIQLLATIVFGMVYLGKLFNFRFLTTGGHINFLQIIYLCLITTMFVFMVRAYIEDSRVNKKYLTDHLRLNELDLTD